MIDGNKENEGKDWGFVLCGRIRKMNVEDNEQARWSERTGIVTMDWDENTRHTVPLGTTLEEFRRTKIMYASYWTLHDSRPYNHICGSG